MHPLARRSLNALVLAGVIAGGTVAATLPGSAKTGVTLTVDGQSSTVTTRSTDVRHLLAGAGYHPCVHDFVAPALDSRVGAGTQVVLQRGRQLEINQDGAHRSVWTTATTLGEAWARLGYPLTQLPAGAQARPLALTATRLDLLALTAVSVRKDGIVQTTTTAKPTAQQQVADLHIDLQQFAQPTSGLTTQGAAEQGATAQVAAGSDVSVATPAEPPAPAADVQQPDPTLAVGATAVAQQGTPGSSQMTYLVVYLAKQPLGRVGIDTQVTPAQPTIIKVGTMQPPDTPAGNQSIASSLLANYGWAQDQMSCLITMWNHESGWRATAANSIGAYGIPQSLPGSKMATIGADWKTNARTQITWGLGYIKARYGSPCQAWSFWQGHNFY